MNTIEQLVRNQERLERQLRALQTKTQQPDPAGWVPVGETWAYASATTFTIATDLTDKYQAGDRLRWTQTTVKHGTVVSAAYSDPNTTITITGDTVLDATISDNYYSKVWSPQGLVPSSWTFGTYSSTSWDGDAKTTANNGVIDLSSVFSMPAGIKGVSVHIDIKAASAGAYAIIAKSSSSLAYGVIARVQVNNQYGSDTGIVQCDANGDVYFTASGNLAEVYIYFNGYFT